MGKKRERASHFASHFHRNVIKKVIGDFYETYMQDAEKASRILGITLTKSSKTKDPEGKPLAMAGFPYHALDSYLPKLIRAGERVAICDQLAPRQEQQKSQSEQREQETQQSHMKR